jgi:hypothetical protein
MRTFFIQLATCIPLVAAGCPGSAYADCQVKIQTGVQTNVWRGFMDYIKTLTPTDQATKNKSRLIHLKAEIVDYESAKQQLIEIVETHVAGVTSAVAASPQLQDSTIADLMTRIENITNELKSIGNDGDLFAAQKPFKDLVLTFDEKRSLTLCALDTAAHAPQFDPQKIQPILNQLKNELTQISAAEDALGDYIKQLKN